MAVTSSAIPPESLVAVVGSGTMGAGIAQVAAGRGHPVILYDARPDAVSTAIQGIRQNFQKLASKGKISGDSAESAAQGLRAASTLGDLRGAPIVIEAIVEELEAKRQLFGELENLVDANCIFATNTSSLSISAIAASLHRPQRLVGMHFFNPAPVMQLVEIIGGLATDAQVISTARATASAWGKWAVVAKSTPGFIVNRVARAYYGEALVLLAEQAADPATLDAVMREAGGFPMGPFELMDLIGLDIGLAVSQSLFHAYFGDARFRPSVIQQEMVRAGYLGRKAARGFYRYDQSAEKPQPQTEQPARKPKRASLPLSGTLAPALAERLAPSELTVIYRDHLAEDQDWIEVDDAILTVTDGRTATQVARETGRLNSVTVDLALDYRKATRIAVAKAEGCTESAYGSVVGLLQSAGYLVSRIKDVPGMAVMRTLSMLANEAADVVNQGVATVADVDTAMRKGVNYPQGPLAWADTLGLPAVEKVLRNLAGHYGGERYRVSSKIQHLVWAGKTITSEGLSVEVAANSPRVCS
jgi:3-hydroxybutyryl-CoA dehydrogenase